MNEKLNLMSIENYLTIKIYVVLDYLKRTMLLFRSLLMFEREFETNSKQNPFSAC